jgi:PP-loop superfamily ATP-utilizing enzyme
MSAQPLDGLQENTRQVHDSVRKIAGRIRQCKSALIAFSGGVDSSVVAALAKQVLEDRAVAVTVIILRSVPVK